MANPTCTRATLISGGACFNKTVFSSQQQAALRVYFDLLQLAANGGTDYSAAIATLNLDATNLACGMQPDNFDTSELVIAYNNAVSAGATVPTARADLGAAIKCLENYDSFQLKQMQLLLYCKLGRGADYPQ